MLVCVPIDAFPGGQTGSESEQGDEDDDVDEDDRVQDDGGPAKDHLVVGARDGLVLVDVEVARSVVDVTSAQLPFCAEIGVVEGASAVVTHLVQQPSGDEERAEFDEVDGDDNDEMLQTIDGADNEDEDDNEEKSDEEESLPLAVEMAIDAVELLDVEFDDELYWTELQLPLDVNKDDKQELL